MPYAGQSQTWHVAVTNEIRFTWVTCRGRKEDESGYWSNNSHGSARLKPWKPKLISAWTLQVCGWSSNLGDWGHQNLLRSLVKMPTRCGLMGMGERGSKGTCTLSVIVVNSAHFLFHACASFLLDFVWDGFVPSWKILLYTIPCSWEWPQDTVPACEMEA